MSGYKIPLSYNEIDAAGLQGVLNRYRGVNHQKIVVDFEARVTSLSGSPYAVALNSGTAALHLALRMLNVGPGDKVLVSTFTYVASVSPILYCGARPVFIDSELETWNMDPGLLEEALAELAKKGKQAKAIIVVHAYGMPAQMSKIIPIAKKWGVPIIEDAAEAFGATIDGKWAGTLGDMGIYSFNNNKSVTTFGGGVLVTKNPQWVHWASKLSTHAREDKPYYEHHIVGYNYAMSPINAAYGLLEAENLENRIEARRVIFRAYQSALGERVGWQVEGENLKSSRWLTCVRLLEKGKNSDIFSQLVDNQEYEIRRGWNPMHRQPVFQEEKAYINGVADRLFESSICLPSGNMKEECFTEILQWLQSVL